MANDIIVSEMTSASQINTNDLMIMTQPDLLAETGYSTKKGTVLQVANKMLKGTEYLTDLPDFTDKTVLGGLEELKGDLTALLPVDTASGAIANFDTDLSLPLVDCKANIVATGGNGTPDNPNPITGYTEANITRCGVNLWDEEWEVGGYNNSTGVPTPEVDRIRNKNHIACKGGMSVYITYPSGMSGGIYVYFWDNTDTLISVAYANSGNSFTFTTPANTAYINFNTQSYYGATYNNNLSFNYPSTDTTYHAYNGQTYTIAFGQTVYGGQLIVLPDRTYFHATHLKYTGTWGDGVAEYAPDTMPDMKRRTFMLSPIAGTAADNNGKAKCNITDVFSTANNLNSPHFYVYDNFYLYAPRTLDDSTPIQCSYVLATPFDIDLTPEVISAIVGTNNVYSDTNGDTEVKYKEGIQHYIDKKIAATQALIL